MEGLEAVLGSVSAARRREWEFALEAVGGAAERLTGGVGTLAAPQPVRSLPVVQWNSAGRR